MKLFELLRDGVAVGEVVEFANGECAVYLHHVVVIWDSLADVEEHFGGELVRRHAPHAFHADRAAYGETA